MRGSGRTAARTERHVPQHADTRATAAAASATDPRALLRGAADGSTQLARGAPHAHAPMAPTPTATRNRPRLVAQYGEGSWSAIARALNELMGTPAAPNGAGRRGKQCREVRAGSAQRCGEQDGARTVRTRSGSGRMRCRMLSCSSRAWSRATGAHMRGPGAITPPPPHASAALEPPPAPRHLKGAMDAR